MTRPPSTGFGAHVARGKAMDRARALLVVHGTSPRYERLADLVAVSHDRLSAIPTPLNEHPEALALWAGAERAVMAELRRLDDETAATTVPPPDAGDATADVVA